MEQVAQVEPGRTRWQVGWLVVTLILVCAGALFVGGGQIALWALSEAFAAPLTLIAALALLMLPGLALLRLLWPVALAPAERWPLALGVGGALPPLLFLASAPLGLRWGSALCWGFLALCALALAWPRGGGWPSTRFWPLDRSHALLLAITGVAVLVRLYAARDLPVGQFGDSYQHTLIAQLLVDNGGLFSSWLPYVPLRTFTYHYGFHSNVAWLHWLSGEPVTRGLLVIGQLQSALAAPLAYLLTRRLLGSEPAALWAALIVGFVSPMPAFYLNWGRYTQLAGQTILPAACVVWMALLAAAAERPFARGPSLRLAMLAALVTAGLALTHYRVAVFAAGFVASFALYLLLIQGRSRLALARMCAAGLASGALALLLVAPWLLRIREGKLLQIGNVFLSSVGSGGETNGLPVFGADASLYANGYLIAQQYVIALALLGVALLAWRRQWRGLVLVGWAALAWLSANPYLLGLAGAGIITNFTVVIGAYLVLAPLAGAALAAIWEWAGQVSFAPRLVEYVQVLAGVALLLWGLNWQQRIVAPQFQLFTPADEQAMAWICRETPRESRFFVNSFLAFGNTLYAGSDGGWWLPFMSGRQSNLPPLTYGSEVGAQPYYWRNVNTTNAAIQQHPPASPEAAAALRAAGFTYLYDGPAASPSGEYINPTQLARSPLYELVYSQGGVTIWRLR